MAINPKTVVFDIIETVFSLEPLREKLAALGLPPTALDAWFPSTLRDFFALGVTDAFVPMREVLGANLQVLLNHNRLAVSEAAIASVLDTFGTLPAHPDAGEAFRHIKAAGARIVALSNGARASTEKLLRGAGFEDFVDQVLSVDDVGHPKPRREVYLYAAQEEGSAPEDMILVATHPWDLHGAKSAGLRTGFVARGVTFPTIFRPPDVVGEQLLDVARALFPAAARA